MPLRIASPKPALDNRAGPILTIWDQWQPACDACGRLESSLKDQQLLSCAGCLLAKYCSVACQKQNWREDHKNRCHLFEADRKLSTVFAKSLGPGTINDPTLSLVDKVIQWNFLNAYNHGMIGAAALKNDSDLGKTVNVGIFLKLVEERTGSKYDHRSFIIDKVALLPRDESDDFAANAPWTKGNVRNPQESMKSEHSKLLVGFCRLPGGVISETQMWLISHGPLLTDTVLPPYFDLHRYITSIAASRISTRRSGRSRATSLMRTSTLRRRRRSQGVIGIEKPDGTRVPLYKYSANGHFRVCAPGESDTEGPEYCKRLLVDPSRMVRMLYGFLEVFDVYQDTLLGMSEKVWNAIKLEIFRPTDGATDDAALAMMLALVVTMHADGARAGERDQARHSANDEGALPCMGPHFCAPPPGSFGMPSSWRPNFQPTDGATEEAALATMQALVVTIHADDAQDEDVQGRVRDACEECIGIVRELEKSQAKPAIKMLCASTATTPSVARYTLPNAIPHRSICSRTPMRCRAGIQSCYCFPTSMLIAAAGDSVKRRSKTEFSMRSSQASPPSDAELGFVVLKVNDVLGTCYGDSEEHADDGNAILKAQASDDHLVDRDQTLPLLLNFLPHRRETWSAHPARP
ncbi:hypothetical protein B0H13DRAFT_2316492 [Mycena leptocephala]|nr:hypothetical protein B0H13DRAFT_2316492 [Mycena leptocephala]